MNKNNTATLTYGSSSGDSASIPSNVLKFEKIYNLLVPTLHEHGSAQASIAVALFKRGDVSVFARYTDKETEIVALFAIAARAAQPFNKTGFEKLLQEVPPFPPVAR